MVEPGRNSPDRPHTGQLVTAAQEKQQNSPNQISLVQFKLFVAPFELVLRTWEQYDLRLVCEPMV